MKLRSIFLAGCVISLSCAASKANITDIYLGDDLDGALNCNYSWAMNSGNGSGTVEGEQMLSPAHVVATIGTDGGDPTFTLNTSIVNSTAFAWASYIVNVTMSTPFTISGQIVNVPADWSATITQVPILVGSDYTGQITMAPGAAPIAIGQTLDFTYSVTFAGGGSFSFTQEMVPVPVPEPGTLGLLACGGLLLALVRRQRR
jgi:hypothetical protein